MFDRKKGMRVPLVLMLHGHGCSRVVYSADDMTVLSEGRKPQKYPEAYAQYLSAENTAMAYIPLQKKSS
ncbi:MAG: hypothetical protein IKX58_06335 [Clostridia bacterium]|nr:hypothetical protein [Clostridia bacterium]